MATFRVHKSKDFTVMSNHHLRNKELSLKAKGLLTLMLSLPDDWDYSILGLAAMSKDGKDSVMSALTELSSFGYVLVENARNDKGQYESVYNVFENPNRENRCGKSESGNPPQYNTNIQSTNTNNDNNEDNSSRIINNTSNNISSTPKKVKKGLDLSFVATEYIEAFGEWLNYKRSIGEMYKTQRGVVRAYKDLLDACNNNPANALAVVNHSIDREYKGIFPPKTQQSYGNSSNETTSLAKQFAANLKATGKLFG